MKHIYVGFDDKELKQLTKAKSWHKDATYRRCLHATKGAVVLP